MVILFSYFDHCFFPLCLQNGYLCPLRYRCDSEKVTKPRKERGMNMNKKWFSIATVALLLSGSLVACSDTTGTPEPATQPEGTTSEVAPGSSTSDSGSTDSSVSPDASTPDASTGSSDTGTSMEAPAPATGSGSDADSGTGSAGTAGTDSGGSVEQSPSTDPSKK